MFWEYQNFLFGKIKNKIKVKLKLKLKSKQNPWKKKENYNNKQTNTATMMEGILMSILDLGKNIAYFV